jgi:hypothetical protein
MSYIASKVMLIRHAEKPVPANPKVKPPVPAYNGIDGFGDPDEHSLIPKGWQRAGALAGLFTSSSGPLPMPHFVFAPNAFGDGTSKRPYQTVTTVAGKLDLVINAAHDGEPAAKYSKDEWVPMLEKATSCRGVVLISWEHGEIPKLANWLMKSDTAPEWPGDRFDIVWIFDLAPAGARYVLSQAPQLLLVGDEAAPIFTSGKFS